MGRTQPLENLMMGLCRQTPRVQFDLMMYGCVPLTVYSCILGLSLTLSMCVPLNIGKDKDGSSHL